MIHQRELSDSEKKEISQKCHDAVNKEYDPPYEVLGYGLGYKDGYTACARESVPMNEFLKVVDSIKYVIKNYTEVDSRMYDNLTEIVESIAHLSPKE